ncbi:ABC transporter permease [Leucobacter allii]|uniref:Transport permease protein n=1 Tax=Leucobacter allii TaxID=2932247 RepID=A0ABY4FN33_9MICO|nr:ABC transporter permease [Leucobacter allii]UOQ57694.1 ABC transporter permease [Leucobacter allii]UOR02238.1 ABC transporter permease [Leucobacter allii]
MSYQAALTDPEFTTPGKSRGLWDIFHHRYLLSLLLKKSVATRYYGSTLGWIWSYVQTIAHFLLYYLVVGLVLGVHRSVELFPVYLFCGLITVNLFSEVLRNTTNAITDNASLVKKIYLPRELFPVAAVGSAITHFLPQAAVLLVICIFIGWTVTWMQIAAFLLGFVVVIVFALGLGLFFGALNVAYRDAHNVVALILMFATWSSPVLYPSEMVRSIAPDWIYQIYMLNPVTATTELFHNVFWLPLVPGADRPDHLMLNGVIALGIALVTLVVGQLTFRKMEGTFAQYL